MLFIWNIYLEINKVNLYIFKINTGAFEFFLFVLKNSDLILEITDYFLKQWKKVLIKKMTELGVNSNRSL